MMYLGVYPTADGQGLRGGQQHDPLRRRDPARRGPQLHNGGCDIGPKVVSYHKCTCEWVTVQIGRALPSPGRIAFVAGGNDLESLVALVYNDAVYLDHEKLLGDHLFVSGRPGRGFIGGVDTLRVTTDPVPGETAPETGGCPRTAPRSFRSPAGTPCRPALRSC
jgi:hypothetical protein